MELQRLHLNDRVKRLFVLLDAFNRDSLYKQCGVNPDFQALTDDFYRTFMSIIEQSGNVIEQLKFSDYCDSIGDVFSDATEEAINILRENKSRLALVKSSLLFLAVCQPIPIDETERWCLARITETLICECPSMIKSTLQGRRGPTPLHVMIAKEAQYSSESERRHQPVPNFATTIRSLMRDRVKYKFEVLKHMLNGLERSQISLNDKTWILRGKTLLDVGLRTLDLETVTFLLLKGVYFDNTNDQGDNMYHSLIRHAHFSSDRESRIRDIMVDITEFLDTNRESLKCKHRDSKGCPEALWGMKNQKGFTPLQLTAKFGLFELFDFIIKQNVYQINDRDRGNFDDDNFDITEIDTVPVRKDTGNTRNMTYQSDRPEEEIHRSVLGLITQLYESSNDKGSEFVGIKVVRKTITGKWKSYRKWFMVWGILHFLMICLYSWLATVRSRMDSPAVQLRDGVSLVDSFAFVVASSTVTVVYAIFCIASQSIVYIQYGLKHRGTIFFFSYCHVFLFFGLCVFVDFICLFAAPQYGDTVLPFSVVIGWYLMVYFLHVVERFGFFTVLMRNVVIHLVQFGAIMLFLLIGFSVAMFVAMKGVDDAEDFQNVGRTFVKMFAVMMGIGEIDVLANAKNPVLVITIFMLFVLITALLMVNALIAIMSNTCSKLTTKTSVKAYVRLQRITAIVHLEAMLPGRFLYPATEHTLYVSSGKGGKPQKRRILSLRPDDDDSTELIDIVNTPTR